MVINVKERNLILLFPQHEEDRIEQFYDFREEVPPNSGVKLKIGD